MLIKHWLQAKKCLIVLDNLEHINQFEALCGERDWFGGGSKLILTTRDAHLLKELKDDELYEAKALVHEESLQLFSLHAFREPTLLKEDYTKLSDGIVTYCKVLPLALEVLGSYLSDKSKEEWISAFEKLRKIPHNDVQAKLKISYDGLPDDHTKSLFLDLVCFAGEIFKETINAMGYFSTIEIRNLVDKCLIMNCQWTISMHNLIREMGREIIRLESPNKPGERSRLWCPNDIHEVLIEQKGTEKIEMIVLNSSMKNMEYKYNTEAFKDMKNLRFLQIDGIHLDGNFKHLSRKALRYLQWNQCPLKYIPSSCIFEKLVILKMRKSNIKEFLAPLKYFQCLESLDLSCCEHLTRTPNFSGAKNLRTLSFRECSSLEKVHSSIGDLGMLVDLDLTDCKRLKKIPKKFWQLRSVEDPSVCYSSNIKELPENSVKLNSLRELRLAGTNIRSLPSNTNLLKPKSIPLSFFQNDLKVIQQFPPNLEGISLVSCKNLEVVSILPTCLKWFHLQGCTSLKMLPKLPHSLVSICLDRCKNLKMLPELPQNLQVFSAVDCESLETVVVHLPKMLKYVNLTNCKKLKEIQGLENAQFLREMKLKGVPNVKFSENINQVLKGSKLDSDIYFEGSFSDNETLSWTKCQEKGSSISFQWPLSNLEFVGICISVVLRQCSFAYTYYVTVVTTEKDGFRVSWEGHQWTPPTPGGNTSILYFISPDSFKDIKDGEVVKVISNSEKSLVLHPKKIRVEENKIRVEALYRDEDGLLQFLPLTKVGSNAEKEEENF